MRALDSSGASPEETALYVKGLRMRIEARRRVVEEAASYQPSAVSFIPALRKHAGSRAELLEASERRRAEFQSGAA